jgi:hypothetical protein
MPLIPQDTEARKKTPDIISGLPAIPENPQIRQELGEAKSEVEKKSIKDQIREAKKLAQEHIKDPEKRKEALIMFGAGLLLWMLKSNEQLDEEITGKEAAQKETENEIKGMAEAGLIEMADKKEENPKEPEKNELFRDLQFTAIQLKASMNKSNTKALNEQGITIPEAAQKLSCTSLFREGIGSYENFKEKLTKILQPDVKNPGQQINNTAEILSRCALGKYQILPIFHFVKLGWTYKGETGLRNMYEFLRSPAKQDQLNRGIIVGLAKKYKGNARAMAAAYYAGDEAGYAILKLAENGQTDLPEWLTREQKMGGGTFGSINVYAKKAFGYYGKDTVNTGNEQDVLVFQRAIGKVETGFLAGKRAKAPTPTVGIG